MLCAFACCIGTTTTPAADRSLLLLRSYRKDYIIKLFRRKYECARARTEMILALKMNFNDSNKMALLKNSSQR
jgi:hypothetical protein